MAQNEMRAKPALPERVRSMEGLAVTSENRQYTLTQHRDELFFKPRIAFEPEVIAWAWMRQGNRMGPELTPPLHYLSE